MASDHLSCWPRGDCSIDSVSLEIPTLGMQKARSRLVNIFLSQLYPKVAINKPLDLP